MDLAKDPKKEKKKKERKRKMLADMAAKSRLRRTLRKAAKAFEKADQIDTDVPTKEGITIDLILDGIRRRRMVLANRKTQLKKMREAIDVEEAAITDERTTLNDQARTRRVELGINRK